MEREAESLTTETPTPRVHHAHRNHVHSPPSHLVQVSAPTSPTLPLPATMIPDSAKSVTALTPNTATLHRSTTHTSSRTGSFGLPAFERTSRNSLKTVASSSDEQAPATEADSQAPDHREVFTPHHRVTNPPPSNSAQLRVVAPAHSKSLVVCLLRISTRPLLSEVRNSVTTRLEGLEEVSLTEQVVCDANPVPTRKEPHPLHSEPSIQFLTDTIPISIYQPQLSELRRSNSANSVSFERIRLKGEEVSETFGEQSRCILCTDAPASSLTSLKDTQEFVGTHGSSVHHRSGQIPNYPTGELSSDPPVYYKHDETMDCGCMDLEVMTDGQKDSLDDVGEQKQHNLDKESPDIRTGSSATTDAFASSDPATSLHQDAVLAPVADISSNQYDRTSALSPHSPKVVFQDLCLWVRIFGI